MKRLFAFALLLLMMGCEGDYALYNLNNPETEQVIVEVEVPVEIEIPGEGGDVWIDSFEQPYTMNGIDIVWVIDMSASMIVYEQLLINGIEKMMQALPPAGWRLGITQTDWNYSIQQQDFPLVPGDTVGDAWDAYSNLPMGHLEAGFDALSAYLVENTYNQTWLRPDAGLLVVFVSDENEQSTRDFTGGGSGLNDFINWYGSQRNSVFLASIVTVAAQSYGQSGNGCNWNVPANYIGSRYIDATAAFGGVVIDICDEDWAAGVQDVAAQTQPHEKWPLTYNPLVNTLLVLEDFVEKDPAEWSYNSSTNTIEFLVVPEEGAFVEIGYVIDHTSGDDDDSAGS